MKDNVENLRPASRPLTTTHQTALNTKIKTHAWRPDIATKDFERQPTSRGDLSAVNFESFQGVPMLGVDFINIVTNVMTRASWRHLNTPERDELSYTSRR